MVLPLQDSLTGKARLPLLVLLCAPLDFCCSWRARTWRICCLRKRH